MCASLQSQSTNCHSVATRRPNAFLIVSQLPLPALPSQSYNGKPNLLRERLCLGLVRRNKIENITGVLAVAASRRRTFRELFQFSPHLLYYKPHDGGAAADGEGLRRRRVNTVPMQH